MGPTMDAHEARWTVSDAEADPQVSVRSTETLDALRYLKEQAPSLLGLQYTLACHLPSNAVLSTVALWREVIRRALRIYQIWVQRS